MEEQIVKENKFKNPKLYLAALGMILVAAIIIVSILRDRWVNDKSNQVTVWGEGKVTYGPDEALVTLGVEVDNVAKAGDATSQLNDKIDKIISSVTALGISKDNIKTDSYNLNPAYNYDNGTQTVNGYNASEHLIIKVENIQSNQDLAGRVISAANDAGANQVFGVNYDVSNPNDLRQEARLAAIKDAENKATALFQAAGMKPGKIIGWTENNTSPIQSQPFNAAPMGSAMSDKISVPAQVPSGTQDIVVDIGVNYEVK